MSSEKFETLDEDVQVLLDILRRKCDSKLDQCHGEEKKQVVAEIERGLDEVRQALFDMEAEARAAPSSFRADMMSRTRAHQDAATRIANLIKNTRRVEGNQAKWRDELFEGGSGSTYPQNRGIDDSLRRTVMQGTEVLERTSQSLFRTTQVALETEEIGTEVIQELGQQRETLTRTRDRLMDTDLELSRSRRILRSMYVGALTNKLVLVVIIVLELAILSGLVYYKFFS